jgi:ABC-type xylose transport system permease subunit
MVVIVAIVIVLLCLTLAAVQSLYERGVGSKWWAALLGCVIIGFVSGIWFGFCFEYQPSPRLRVAGFPIPAGFFALEGDVDGGDEWTDFPTPAPALFAALNIVPFTFLFVQTVWIANTICRRLAQRRTGQGTSLMLGPSQPPARASQ